jgi:phosphohistidine swiveling domain-containing protein
MLRKEDYFLAVRRAYPMFFASLIFNGFSNINHYRFFLSEPFATKDWVMVDHNFHYTKADIRKAARLVFEEWSNPKRFEEVKNELVRREKRLIQAVNSDLKEFSEAYEAYMPALILVWSAEEPVSEKVRELLLKKLSKEEVDGLMDKLNIPLEDNFYKKEEFDLVNTDDLKNHVKEHVWILSRYGEQIPYTIEKAKEKLSKINKEEFLKKWHEDKEKLKKVISYAKKLIGNEHLIDFLQFILYYRTQRTDIMNKAGCLFIPKLKAIAKEKGLTYGYACVGEDYKVRYVYGKDVDELRKFIEEDVGDISEVKGAVASRGKVIGRAKIIQKSEEFSKLEKGDILITSMTTPDYVPIMYKAAAFVTDEGGITCHAAIVSREMGKPCVIGTKIATKVLKDGDLVEVDAENGVVRKIE